jgi:imidazolonepropionase-like amidohydrolase
MVTISEEKIAGIQEYRRGSEAKTADVIDGRGKFLIPGLWDMHVHWYDERFLPLFIANGVTGVRQMWGMEVHQQWRQKVKDGSLVGPRQSIASPLIDGPKPVWQGSITVQTEAEARAAVIAVKKDGADFVKVYEKLPRDAYFAIADQSRKEGMPFAGHVPFTVRLSEASDAGQKSIEHLTGVFIEASRQEEKIRNEVIEGVSSSGDGGWSGLVSVRLGKQVLDTFDAQKAASIYTRLAKNHTWQTPTLTVLRAISRLNDSTFMKDARLKYMPASIREQWNPQNDQYLNKWTVDDWAYGRALFDKELRIVGEMHRQGVQFLAGTDTLNPFCFPGFSLHDELALLVTAGLTPMEALQAATRSAAEYLGILDSFGTVEEGKAADLVVLAGNPLDDITNTRKIAGVMMRGRYFPKASLEKMLADVEAVARLKSISEPLTKALTEDGVAGTVAQYRRMRKEEPAAYDFSEDALIDFANQLIAQKRTNDAIQILKLEVENYPKYWSAYDSLGDAYKIAGQKGLAITNYKRSLELEPGNGNAMAQLKAFGAQQ